MAKVKEKAIYVATHSDDDNGFAEQVIYVGYDKEAAMGAAKPMMAFEGGVLTITEWLDGCEVETSKYTSRVVFDQLD